MACGNFAPSPAALTDHVGQFFGKRDSTGQGNIGNVSVRWWVRPSRSRRGQMPFLVSAARWTIPSGSNGGQGSTSDLPSAAMRGRARLQIQLQRAGRNAAGAPSLRMQAFKAVCSAKKKASCSRARTSPILLAQSDHSEVSLVAANTPQLS